MRKLFKYIGLLLFVLLLIHSLELKSQNFQNKTSCFAHVVIQDSMIAVWVGPMQSSSRMHPQVFYDHVFYSEYPFIRFCSQMDDIKKEVERIKSHLATVKINELSEEERLKLIEEIALRMIWNNLFNIPKQKTMQRLEEMDEFNSNKTKLPLELVNHLYRQVYDDA